jgi:hypothetical protein
MLLFAWCILALLILLASIVVHASTFFGIDPIAVHPGVMMIHLAIFPPFIAALIYAKQLNHSEKDGQKNAMERAPRWIRIATGIFGAYAAVNFILFMVLSEGVGAYQQDGKFVLRSSGRVISEISEEKFHRRQAYVARGFSGHWMLFSCAALMMLSGVREARKAGFPKAPPAEPPKPDVVGEALAANPAPQPTTRLAGSVALLLYVLCLLMIFSSKPVLSLTAAIPASIAGVIALRQKFGFPRKPFHSVIGCLCVFPNFFFATLMGKLVAQFIYIAIYVGLGAAVMHEVQIVEPKAGPSHLSNGLLVNNRVSSALMFFVQFPVIVLAGLGLTHMAEHVGRLIEVRRQAPRRWR